MNEKHRLPEDSTLKRHYVTYLASIIATVIGTRPTDNTLRRHYDSLVAATLEECLQNECKAKQMLSDYEAYRKRISPLVAVKAPDSTVRIKTSLKTTTSLATHVPQDFVLRRHYTTHLASMIAIVTGLRPTDNTLRRHYDNLVAAKLEECLEDELKAKCLINDYETCSKAFKQAVKTETKAIVKSLKTFRPHLPEDSMLKRHYTTHLASMIAALAGPCPTENTLHRHYENQIACKLGACLEDEKQAEQLFNDYYIFRQKRLQLQLLFSKL